MSSCLMFGNCNRGWSDAYKVLIHDGLGVWLCTRQLDDSKFHGLGNQLAKRPLTDTHGLTLTQSQFNALISGLPWHNLGKDLLTPLI